MSLYVLRKIYYTFYLVLACSTTAIASESKLIFKVEAPLEYTDRHYNFIQVVGGSTQSVYVSLKSPPLLAKQSICEESLGNVLMPDFRSMRLSGYARQLEHALNNGLVSIREVQSAFSSRDWVTSFDSDELAQKFKTIPIENYRVDLLRDFDADRREKLLLEVTGPEVTGQDGLPVGFYSQSVIAHSENDEAMLASFSKQLEFALNQGQLKVTEVFKFLSSAHWFRIVDIHPVSLKIQNIKLRQYHVALRRRWYSSLYYFFEITGPGLVDTKGQPIAIFSDDCSGVGVNDSTWTDKPTQFELVLMARARAIEDGLASGKVSLNHAKNLLISRRIFDEQQARVVALFDRGAAMFFIR